VSLVARQFQRLPESSRSILLTGIYGLLGGLAAVAFELGINWVYLSTFVALSHRTLVVFLLGSLAVVVGCSLGGGWLMSRVEPGAAGSGIPQLKFAFWQDFGFVRLQAVIVKFVAGLLHVGGGMSLGREGPSVFIAGGIASEVSGALGIPKQRRRRPAAAGAAAGLAAAFNTPLAAITFVLEEIVQDLNSPLVGSVILASVLGAFAVHAIIGENPAFVLPQIEGATWRAYLGVPLASAFASLVGIAFQRATLRLRGISKNWNAIPRWIHPLLGGFEQLALPNVLEIDADEIDFLPADWSACFELLLAVAVDRLILERLWFFVLQDLLGAGGERLSGVLHLVVRFDGEPEFLGPMAPVEHVHLLGRVVPVDERLSPPRRAELERFGTSARSFRHMVLR